MNRAPDAASEIAREVAAVRPALAAGLEAELPGARAAVLTRLWRALAHEPLPWVAARERSGDALTLRLRDGRRLRGPVCDPYATGAYAPEVCLDGTAFRDPARLMAALGVPHAAGLAAELDHSAASLALSRAGAGNPTIVGPPSGWPHEDWAWEQRVVDGHPYHPNCRSRPGFSAVEQLAYGPEHRPLVPLGLLPVPAADCLVTGAWPARLRDGERLLLPVHPWQAAHVLKRAPEPGPRAHPLMALRTLALADGADGGVHVKTSLSARLTSSVRDISVWSVGVSAALSSFAESVEPRVEGLLAFTRTLGAATAHSPDLAAVLRESPRVYAGPGERVLPVAALPVTGLTRRADWLARFARLALTAGLRLLDLGVALEAHGQNLLVVLDATGEPVRLVYRDLADIRVSPARLRRHGLPVPDIAGRIVTDDVTALRRKAFGSLIGGALAAAAGSGPALCAALRAALPGLPPAEDLSSLRHDPLPVKALTLMRLSPERPGDRWATLPNPVEYGEG